MRKLVPAIFGINAMIAFSSLLVFGVTFVFASSYTRGLVNGIDIAATRSAKEIYRTDQPEQPDQLVESQHVVQNRQRRKASRTFPMEVMETQFSGGHVLHPDHIIESSPSEQQQQQTEDGEEMSTTSTIPLGEGGDGLEPDEIGYIVGASALILACCCGGFCVWYDHMKRKAEKEREHRMMMSIFKYVQVFDVDDIDIRRTPAGGYECTYLNDLAYGGNIAPAGSSYSSRGAGLSKSSPKRVIGYKPSTEIQQEQVTPDPREVSNNSRGQGSEDYMFMSGEIKYASSRKLDA